MAYYHHHNSKGKHIRIHSGECSDCNEGKGKITRSARKSESSVWSPAFSSYLKAYLDATSVSRQLNIPVEDHDCIEKLRAAKQLGAIEK